MLELQGREVAASDEEEGDEDAQERSEAPGKRGAERSEKQDAEETKIGG